MSAPVHVGFASLAVRDPRDPQNLIPIGALERSVILSTGAVLSGSLPERTGTLKLAVTVTLKDVERSHILQTLQQTKVWSAAGMGSHPAGYAANNLNLQNEAPGNQLLSKLSSASARDRIGGMSRTTAWGRIPPPLGGGWQ
jgi:hypothetical protein